MKTCLFVLSSTSVGMSAVTAIVMSSVGGLSLDGMFKENEVERPVSSVHVLSLRRLLPS